MEVAEMRNMMFSDQRIHTIILLIDKALSITPSGEASIISANILERGMNKEEHEQIFKMLEKDWKILRVLEWPGTVHEAVANVGGVIRSRTSMDYLYRIEVTDRRIFKQLFSDEERILSDAAYNMEKRRLLEMELKQRAEQKRASSIESVTMEAVEKIWDVFISHASEDKSSVAEPLERALKIRGIKVWYDKSAMTIGDSLPRKIDEGLSKSTYGIIIFSPGYFAEHKHWPRAEMDALMNRELSTGKKVILPVWHNIGVRKLGLHSPILASRLAGQTSEGIEKLADDLILAMRGDK